MPNAATPAKIVKIAIPMIQLRFDCRRLISVPGVGVSGGKTLMSVCDCVAIIIPILVLTLLTVVLRRLLLAAADCEWR